MVRLLHQANSTPINDMKKFQSHNGAIAARRIRPTRLEPLVSIPQWCDCCLIDTSIACFNNSVSIPQWCDCCRSEGCVLVLKIEFQSHNGAIAADELRRQLMDDALVSIPQWCDCCQGKIWGFGGRMRRNEGRVAVDLRLPEEPKGVDGK